jgi:signal transduction histidine kinase
VGLWLRAPGASTEHLLLEFLLAASLACAVLVCAPHPAIVAIILVTHAGFLIGPDAVSPLAADHSVALLAALIVAVMTMQAFAQHASVRRLLTLERERSELVEGLRGAKQESDRERASAAAAGRAKSQFLSHMNHELRTPMNAILGFSELIRRSAVDKHIEYAGIIHQSGLHLLRLIDDMLDLARIEGGRPALRESEVDLACLVREHGESLEARAEEARLSLCANVMAGLPPVFADARALQQILANLSSNALKYTPAGGCVTLFARLAEDGRLAFGVEDTGIGIGIEDRRHVFERFGRGRHDVTAADRGTGLGLAIVKGFAEAHDGEVVLESELGWGTRVTAYLPAERICAASSPACLGAA